MMAAAMFGGAGSLLTAGSAQATVVPGSICYFGPDIQQPPIDPLVTPLCATYDSVTNPTGTQFQIQDKLVNLGFLNFNGKSGTLGFQWTQVSPPGYENDQFSLQLNFNPDTEGPYTGEFNYQIFVTDPGFQFATAELDSVVSGVLTTTTVTKMIAGFGTLISTNGGNVPGLTISGTTLSVRNQWDVKTGDVLNNFGDTYTQKPSGAPGPLPLLGAGMALGFSRKLRSRIKGSVKA